MSVIEDGELSQLFAVWGAPSECTGNSLEDSFRKSGNNFGNILIGNGLKTSIEKTVKSSFVPLNEAEASDSIRGCAKILIPAANFLWHGFDLGFLADQLGQNSLPILMAGLGAQSSDRIIPPRISAGTQRLLDIVASRSKLIGVRGHYTAEVMCSLGIHNTVALGCPSFFTVGLPGHHRLPIKPFHQNLDLKEIKGCINSSRRVSRHSFFPAKMQVAENEVLRLAVANNWPFVAQDEIPEISLSQGLDTSIQEITTYFNRLDPETVSAYYTSNSNYFTTVHEWSAYISNFDIVIGSRFHGCLIALLSGVPALLLVHDSRTLEMAELAGIPYAFADAITSEEDIYNLLINLDYSRFFKNMKSLEAKYCQFLDDNEVTA